MEEFWQDYYLKQVGSGIAGHYSGQRYQNGNGFWGTIFKKLRPALNYIKRPLLNAASNITKDMANGGDFSSSASQQLIESGKHMLNDGLEKLIKKQRGNGLRRRVSKKKRSKKRVVKKKKNLYKKRRPKKKIVKGYL